MERPFSRHLAVLFSLTIKSNKSLSYFDSKYWIFGQENQLFFYFGAKKEQFLVVRSLMNFLIVAIFDSSSFLLLRWLLNLSWWEISASWNISGAKQFCEYYWASLTPNNHPFFQQQCYSNWLRKLHCNDRKRKKAQHFLLNIVFSATVL